MGLVGHRKDIEVRRKAAGRTHKDQDPNLLPHGPRIRGQVEVDWIGPEGSSCWTGYIKRGNLREAGAHGQIQPRDPVRGSWPARDTYAAIGLSDGQTGLQIQLVDGVGSPDQGSQLANHARAAVGGGAKGAGGEGSASGVLGRGRVVSSESGEGTAAASPASGATPGRAGEQRVRDAAGKVHDHVIVED